MLAAVTTTPDPTPVGELITSIAIVLFALVGVISTVIWILDQVTKDRPEAEEYDLRIVRKNKWDSFEVQRYSNHAPGWHCVRDFDDLEKARSFHARLVKLNDTSEEIIE